MSENPNEIYGDGVTINGTDITWFRLDDGETPRHPRYSFIGVEPFGISE